ncbi:hypothetical protein [Novosphingobium pituita]|uniref:Uncharacterized protein n=1 Tax=Novosphingobium pituita TaxID=3056842 RepID=A0ABQ6P7J9_9SPHN|nr:hypothetical protein [Novosphingobium sp. IK01]GMM60892.1 hypothetical protein NUTIK01_16690 [Novosphingobium sp. IK01]
MNVIDHQPHAWYLLEDNGVLFIDAACSHSFVDYSVLIELDKQELQNFESDGRSFLDQLAYDIHYSAPGVRGSNSPYKSRNLAQLRAEEVSEAVKIWQAARIG